MQHHQSGAGSPYMAPTTDMVPFSLPPASGPVSVSSMPPPIQPQPPAGTCFEELPAAGSGAAAVNFHDDDMLVDVGCGGSVSEAGGSSGNRWPREEALALIRIRSEMDAAFRNAAFKAPVWEEVSRKLAELGYHRSAKKCKEKFENVDKYYKRTKEGRAGRQDGKSYRFFSQLEALHAAAPKQHQAMAMAAAAYTATLEGPQPLAMARMAPEVLAHPGVSLPDLSFSSNSESESDGQSDDEEEEGSGKLTSGDGGSNKRMMALFEGMMKQITEKQDAMQRLFLETLDKWEEERTAREETWRRKEVARINREREELARERTAAASRDAALIAFLQSVGGQSVQLPPSSTVAVPKPMPVHTPPPPHHDAAATSLQLVPVQPKVGEGWAGGESSGATSRWPKEEVHALIQLRMEKDEHYQDMGPKGPLWEDISAGMRRIGYNRSSKRCKEKWENINKYFKKVKESNKRRPEDSKTCPYFHQLDAIYRKKRFAGSGGGSSAATGASMAVVTSSEPENPQRELEGKSSNEFDKRNIGGGENLQAPPGTGDDRA